MQKNKNLNCTKTSYIGHLPHTNSNIINSKLKIFYQNWPRNGKNLDKNFEKRKKKINIQILAKNSDTGHLPHIDSNKLNSKFKLFYQNWPCKGKNLDKNFEKCKKIKI